MAFQFNTVHEASASVAYELRQFAATIDASEREAFFHPANRDTWVAEFCEWLAAKQRKSAEVRASND